MEESKLAVCVDLPKPLLDWCSEFDAHLRNLGCSKVLGATYKPHITLNAGFELSAKADIDALLKRQLKDRTFFVKARGLAVLCLPEPLIHLRAEFDIDMQPIRDSLKQFIRIPDERLHRFNDDIWAPSATLAWIDTQYARLNDYVGGPLAQDTRLWGSYQCTTLSIVEYQYRKQETLVGSIRLIEKSSPDN